MSAGNLIVETESGSLYLVELMDDADETMWITRVSDPGSPGGWSERLRRDGERMRLLTAEPPVIGQPWLLVLDLRQDGVQTYRLTTDVVSVHEAHEYGSPVELDEQEGEHGPH